MQLYYKQIGLNWIFYHFFFIVLLFLVTIIYKHNLLKLKQYVYIEHYELY